MPEVSSHGDRRQGARSGLRVIHRHRIGNDVAERTSELVFVRGRPLALLEWIDIGGARTPLYACELDPERLREDPERRGTFHYDELTSDPRFPTTD
jgi:hypothetical protein